MKRNWILFTIGAALALAFVAGRMTVSPGGVRTATSHRVLYYVDPMHPAYRSDKPGVAPDCGMALEAVYEGDEGRRAALPPSAIPLSSQKQQLIGIRVETITASSGTRIVRTTGRVVPDDNRLYRIMAGAEGWIQSLGDNPPGAAVRKHQLLAALYSPDFRVAETTYLSFVASVDRLRATMDANDQKKIEDTLHVNEEQLRLLGMGDVQLDELRKTHRTTSSINLVSPGDGVVLARNVSPNQRFDKGAELYRIADLRHVWIVADVHGDDTGLRPGMRARITIPELARTIEARVSSNTPLFDPATRTMKLRLEADNPGLLLRPDMFVDVEFETKAPAGLSVPSDAVLDSGMRKIVYVETAAGVFEPRPVEIAAAYGERVALAKGVTEGDRVVVAGNFLLDSESRMRANPQPLADSQAQVQSAVQHSAFRDPVCGMTMRQSDSNLAERYHGETFYFCSDSCRKQFRDDPSRFAGEKSASVMNQRQLERHHD
jgi:membrane fusion protein, copper/silver efflux system